MNAKTSFKVVGGILAFFITVWILVIVMMKSDHVAQQKTFEKSCHQDGLFLEYRDGRITNCIDGDHKIVRQYRR